MQPVKIEGDAKPIGKPDNWDEVSNSHCATLFVRRDVDGDGLPYLRSAWEASEQEAGWMIAGAKVQLGINAVQHPVVQLGLGPLPEDFAPPFTITPIVSTDGETAIRVTMYLPEYRTVYAEASTRGRSTAAAAAHAIDAIEQIARDKGWAK